jgi:Arc/MetJ-type ribon-helix-helix transcriptional regulator
MNSKLKNYSLTLDEYYVEDLRDEIKSKKNTLSKSLSDYINKLLVKDFETRKGEIKQEGNLTSWLKKYPKTSKKSLTKRTNNEISSFYANKFGR